MSELAQITKAIEESQGKMQALFDAQKKEIEATGQISKQLQDDLVKVNDELKTAGTRLFDLEQRLTKGGDDPATTKSFAEQTAEDLQKNWDGKSSKVDVKTFHKALGSGAGSAGALVQPMQMPGILMPGLRRLTIRDLLAQGRTTSNAVEYVRENVYTNSAAPVA
ncbi:phage major capsid protein, partial [Metapseudomonas otitidis]